MKLLQHMIVLRVVCNASLVLSIVSAYVAAMDENTKKCIELIHGQIKNTLAPEINEEELVQLFNSKSFQKDGQYEYLVNDISKKREISKFVLHDLQGKLARQRQKNATFKLIINWSLWYLSCGYLG